MKILCTGAKGFIGSVLMTRGREQGHKMIGVDDYSRGLNPIQPLKYDCRNGVAEIFDEFVVDHETPPFDAVVHLAAGTGSLDRPYEELVELNVEMTKNVYRDAVKYGVKVFAFPTTSLVEGVPDAPYVRSKQDAMNWLLEQSLKDEINVIPLQFYNVTGGYKGCSEIRQREVHIVPIMVEKFLKGDPFIINGGEYPTVDGTPGRDFSNVNNVTDFILHLIGRQLQAPFKSANVIKVGTGAVTTAKEMIEIFNRLMATRGFLTELKYEIGPVRPYDCAYLRCDQPYLHVFRRPTDIVTSLRDETNILLKEVYGL